MGDAVLSLEDPRALQLDLPRWKAVEEAAPLAEKHRDDVELELVEDPGGKCKPSDPGAVDEHVPVARLLLGSSHRHPDVRHVRDEWPLRDVDAGLFTRNDVDRYAVVVV